MNVDDVLEAGRGGPTVQHVIQKEDKLFMTFSCEVDRQRAISIFESKDDLKNAVKILPNPKRSYPVVALYTGKEDLTRLKEDLEFRNPYLAGGTDMIRPLSTKSDHVKIFVPSKSTQQYLLKRGRLFLKDRKTATFTSHKVVEVDPNKEVRRCYRCQAYGHISAGCTRQERCGYCAGRHASAACKSSQIAQSHKCVNCEGHHQSGHPSCPDQKKAVERYKKFLNN